MKDLNIYRERKFTSEEFKGMKCLELKSKEPFWEKKKKKRRVGGGNGIGMETQFLLDI